MDRREGRVSQVPNFANYVLRVTWLCLGVTEGCLLSAWLPLWSNSFPSVFRCFLFVFRLFSTSFLLFSEGFFFCFLLHNGVVYCCMCCLCCYLSVLHAFSAVFRLFSAVFHLLSPILRCVLLYNGCHTLLCNTDVDLYRLWEHVWRKSWCLSHS